MAVAEVTDQSKFSANCLNYIVTGHYDSKGQFNAPHPTRGDKSIMQRNYKLQGINCPDDPNKASEMFGQYNELADSLYTPRKGQGRIQCTNVVVAFGPELDWRRPQDLYRGSFIVHRLCGTAFPNHGVYTGYQMDTSGKVPSAHVHLCVGQFNLISGRVLDKNSYHTSRLSRTLDDIVRQSNHAFGKQLTVMKQYEGQGRDSHRYAQPTLAQRRLLPKLNILLRSRLMTDDGQLVHGSSQLGVIVHIHHIGDKRATSRHPCRKPFTRDAIAFRIPGKNGTSGYQTGGQLRWLTKYQPNINLLHNMRMRRTMYHINQQYLDRHDDLREMSVKARAAGGSHIYEKAMHINHKRGHDVISDDKVMMMMTNGRIRGFEQRLNKVYPSLSTSRVRKTVPSNIRHATNEMYMKKSYQQSHANNSDKGLISRLTDWTQVFAHNVNIRLTELGDYAERRLERLEKQYEAKRYEKQYHSFDKQVSGLYAKVDKGNDYAEKAYRIEKQHPEFAKRRDAHIKAVNAKKNSQYNHEKKSQEIDHGPERG